MSRIYFYSQNKTVEVSGAERAYFGVFCTNLSWAILSNYTNETIKEKSILRCLFPQEHYVNSFYGDFSSKIKMAFSCNLLENLILDGEKIELFALHLNTALSMGSDFIKLAARLHGQCELHTYVEGNNRAWLAEIIKKGRESKFYREDMGWESVIELLEKDETTPVVTSYSVCDPFPNEKIANFNYPVVEGEENSDAWYRLPYQQQWEFAIAGLRQTKNGLELRPENWNDFFFSTGIDANKLIDKLKKSMLV